MSELTTEINSDLKRLVDRIEEASTLPYLVQKINQITTDPKSSASDLAQAIQADPAISARILRCVNSAASGVRQEITNLPQAITLIGFRQARNLALTATVCRSFQGKVRIGVYDRHHLWRHMSSVAVLARMVARRQGMQNFEEVFMAGLLHDLGIILLDQYDHTRFEALMKQYPHDQPLDRAEREHYGFDHSHLGHLVSIRWGLPETVQHVIRYHHSPNDEGFEGEMGKILACVVLANTLCTLQGIGSIQTKNITLSAHAIELLNLDPEDLKIIAEDMMPELELHDVLINLPAAA